MAHTRCLFLSGAWRVSPNATEFSACCSRWYSCGEYKFKIYSLGASRIRFFLPPCTACFGLTHEDSGADAGVVEQLLTLAFFAIAAPLAFSWYERGTRIADLERTNERNVRELRDAMVISESDLRKKPLAVYLTIPDASDRQQGLYIERDPTGVPEDAVTERHEIALDNLGRCVSHTRYTDRGSIFRYNCSYGSSQSREPISEEYYDEEGRKEVWIDVLEDPQGQRLAYMRSRASNDLRDIVLYERDEHGVVRRELEVDHVPWPYSLADIPTKFHSEFQGKAPTVTEYTYEENVFTDSQLQIKKRGSDIEVSEEKNGDVRQIIESRYDGVNQVKHYFPSERDALVTVIVSKAQPQVEVHVDFSKNYRNAIARVSDRTASCAAEQTTEISHI